jgi:hypothetical protein
MNLCLVHHTKYVVPHFVPYVAQIQFLSLMVKSRWGFNFSDVSLLCFRAINSSAEAGARRRISLDKQGPTVVHQKPGPLQTIFELPPDEVGNYYNFSHSCIYLIPIAPTCKSCCSLVLFFFQVVDHSYSCALERSFLYHGRMYVSSWHICFHSNVFSKQIKVSSHEILNWYPLIKGLIVFTVDPLFRAYLFMSLW